MSLPALSSQDACSDPERHGGSLPAPRSIDVSSDPERHGGSFPEHLRAFVLSRTAPAPVPLVPELVLLQASEVHELWEATRAEDSPYWAFPWAGGQALARYVLDRPELVRGRRVADFATGSGLVAIAAARAGAAEVLALDRDPLAEVATALNADRNGVAVPFRLGDALGALLPGFDLVLAGDVFYERGLAAGALRWFADLAGRGVRVVAGDAGRTYAPREGFTELAPQGAPDEVAASRPRWIELAGYDVPTTTAIEASGVRRARVLELRP